MDNKRLLLGVLVTLGVIAGLASSALSIKIIVPVVMGAILFVMIYENIQLGIILFLIFNLLLPQAGPGIDLGIATPVGERGIHFNIHEVIMAMVLVTWLIKIFLKKADWRAKSPLIWPVVFYVLVSILACLVGFAHGARPLIVIFRFVRTTIFVYIFFVVINNIKTRKQLQQILIVTLICATLIAGLGLMQYALGEEWAASFNKKVLDRIGYPENINYVTGEAEGQTYRVNATFAHPNVLGGYLVLFLPFFVSMLWCYRRSSYRLLLFVALAMNLTCLYLTGSRSAWIGAVAVAILYMVLGLLDRRLILTLILVVMVVAALFILIAPPEYLRIRLRGSGAQMATDIRVYQYKMVADLFVERPLFGLGEGMVGQMVKMGNIREMWGAVESAFLTYLVSHGLVGLLSFLLIWIVFWGMMLGVRKRSRGDPLLYYTSEALGLGMVGYAVASIFGPWLLFAIAMWTMWWFYLGFGASVSNLSLEQVSLQEPAEAAA